MNYSILKTVLVLFLLSCVMGHGQDTAEVKVLARSLPDKVLLRWAVDQPLAWKKANTYGFWLERATISRDGKAVVPIERQSLVSNPLKPQPLEAWEALATQDKNAAVVAQSLYGDTFEVNLPSDMGGILAINEELEQRFTFGLVAAEQSYDAAKLAGWGFEDLEIKEGETYVYKVSVALPAEKGTPINEGTVLAGASLYEPLPKPIGLAGVFDDGNVVLSWNFDLLQNIYTNYIVERSTDSINYKPLNGAPIFNAQQPGDGSSYSLFYQDSIPNGIKYYYRIKGRTTFGETGPPSNVLQGMAKKSLAFVPHINRKTIPNDSTVILEWDFNPKGNTLIKGFELRRANRNKGPYEKVGSLIAPYLRKTTYKGLNRVNYFTIVALAKNGAENASFPVLVQPVDSIPPKPPTGFTGTIDTLGIVRLSWNKNNEADVFGYRIYRANSPEVEFSPITKSVISEAFYVDTIEVKNLNKKVYYKLIAEDQRYNKSEFSKILSINKPDRSPPSPPVIAQYNIFTNGVELQWIPSSSSDVASHVVYRKEMEKEQDAGWGKIKVIKDTLDTAYTDTKALEGKTYSYTIIASDSTGFESSPARPIRVTIPPKPIAASDIRFFATPDRESKSIRLEWNVKSAAVLEYRLYRGANENSLMLYKTLDGKSKGFIDTSLEINSDYIYGLQVLYQKAPVSLVKKILVNY